MDGAGQRRRRAKLPHAAVAVVVAAGIVGIFVASLSLEWWPERAEAASGPCGTSHDALDAQEQQLLVLLQQWRAERGKQLSQLEVSEPLNKAAAWFAQHITDGYVLGGHQDSYGRNWVQRAIDCGYDSYYAWGSGEGTFALVSSNPLPPISPADAMAGLDYPGSGINISASSPPAKCVGVGRSRSADGRREAWIVVIAQFPAGQPCPGALTGATPTPSPSPPPSSTPTPSPTPTSSPVPTATPTPTPPPPQWRSVVPGLSGNVSHD